MSTTLYVTDHGDESVGIPSQSWAVECPFEYNESTKEEREGFAIDIENAFSCFLVANVTVRYKEEIDAQERAYRQYEQQMKDNEQ